MTVIMFRKDRLPLAGIEGGVGLGPLLDGLHLGGVCVEIGHSERARFILVGSGERDRERVGGSLVGGGSLYSHLNHV